MKNQSNWKLDTEYLKDLISRQRKKQHNIISLSQEIIAKKRKENNQ